MRIPMRLEVSCVRCGVTSADPAWIEDARRYYLEHGEEFTLRADGSSRSSRCAWPAAGSTRRSRTGRTGTPTGPRF
jgi:hypothetical protein